MRKFLAVVTGAVLAAAVAAAPAGEPASPAAPVAPEGKAADKPAAGPQVVRVGVYVLSMGKLDVTTGSFTIDYYLTLRSEQPIAENSFEFMNGRAGVEKITDEKDAETGLHVKVYRVLANLSSPIDFRQFPFDGQRLQVIMEDKAKPASELVYAVDPEKSGFDPSVTFPGWKMHGWSPSVAVHDYGSFDKPYSQYVFSVGIERIRMNSFLKTFLPVLFLMLIMISSFILNPEQIVTRLATISSSLVASAMFHISIASQIPPVGYLTFADKFMMLTYFILLVSFFLNIGIFVLQGREKKEPAQRLHRLSEKLVFVGVPVLYGALFLFLG
ncbi:MAG TPA: hypothetical protein PK280_03350 [Planctomycetota bacterium]|nr:hypothetical protein [Planctomycetota bacterium]